LLSRWQVFPRLRRRKTSIVAGLSHRSVRNCERIAERFVATEKRFALTGGKSDKTCEKQGLMSASIGRIGAKELRGRNSALTVVKSELIYASCATTDMSCDRIGAISVAIVVTFDETGAMREGTRNKWGKGKRGRGKGNSTVSGYPDKSLLPFAHSP
jgi:hypothetical protein